MVYRIKEKEWREGETEKEIGRKNGWERARDKERNEKETSSIQ